MLDGHFYGVKTFKMDDDGQPVTEGLPYTPEIATADMDMWAIGALLFLFITGENLFMVNRDDDLVSVDGMRAVSGACIMRFYVRAIATATTAAAACIATAANTEVTKPPPAVPQPPLHTSPHSRVERRVRRSQALMDPRSGGTRPCPAAAEP